MSTTNNNTKTNNTTNSTELITSLTEVKSSLVPDEKGVVSLTIDGVTTTNEQIFTKDIIPVNLNKLTMLEDKAGAVLKSHMRNITKRVNNVKVNLIYIGKELAEIRADKSFKDISKTFDGFLRDIGIAKATGYHYITGYLMVCDVFGNINEKALATGDVTVFKADRIGMNGNDFVELAEKCAKEGEPLTAENLIDKAKAHNVNVDREKVEKELKKSKKTVTVIPEIATGNIRFNKSKTEYIDIPMDTIHKKPADIVSAIISHLSEGTKGYYNCYDAKVEKWHIVTTIHAGELAKVYTCIEKVNTEIK